MLECRPIPIFSDNYVWCIIDTETDSAILVDPGDARAVEDYIEAHHLRPVGIVITHHHFDHVGGVKGLTDRYQIPVIGSQHAKFNGITQPHEPGSNLRLLGHSCEILAVPGHTLDHVAYYLPSNETRERPWLFCGDTLFSGGCGRLFEGSPEQMYRSLQVLNNLPADTLVFCTHEYTLANLKFAVHVDPSNAALARYQADCERKRSAGHPTLPSEIGLERMINPFLRCEDDALIDFFRQHEELEQDNPVSVFAALRTLKDNF